MQRDLFGVGDGPPGFQYVPDTVPPDEEEALLAVFGQLPFEPFQFHQYTGLRRIVSYGFRYDYTAQRVREANPIPEFLHLLRAKAGQLVEAEPVQLQQALVTEYAERAGIGWHRDKPAFDKVVAFSFGSDAKLRFRRNGKTGWERKTVRVAPRSAYVLAGAARSEWEHSVPAVASLRYSVTFRNFVERKMA